MRAGRKPYFPAWGLSLSICGIPETPIFKRGVSKTPLFFISRYEFLCPEIGSPKSERQKPCLTAEMASVVRFWNRNLMKILLPEPIYAVNDCSGGDANLKNVIRILKTSRKII